ncbi:MAG: hypothetical protein PHY28_01585 [Dehalococcoidales bacterium]|nr:hypothetical protein [Dehalococcoidales bacterium]
MVEKSLFDTQEIGTDLGTWEIPLDEKAVRERAAQMQWQITELIDRLHMAPPGMTFDSHSKMKFAKFPNMKAAIWAKSEHEFLKPLKIGGKAFVRGKIADKYIKRGRNYIVTEFETFDENGEVLIRSRETGINVE